MIVRQSVSCATCTTKHTLRISIGSGKTQSHSFSCTSCEQKISIYFEKTYNDASFKNHKFENCEPCDEEGVIVNLHPDFIIPGDKVHEDKYFASIETLSRLHETKAFQRVLEQDGTIENYSDAMLQERSLQDNADLFALGTKVISLVASGKEDIAESLVDQEREKYGIPERASLNDIVDAVCSVGGVRSRTIEAELNAMYEETKEKNSKELDKAWTYLSAEHLQRIVSSFAEAYSTISKFHRDFLPVVLHERLFGETPEEGSVSSINFDETKMIYGNLYEMLTSTFVIPAVLNNILNPRSFDTFQQMTLKDYLAIDKSGRHHCFASRGSLSILSEDLDNQLRNASHHQDITINTRTGRITYKSGKSAIRRYMSYVNYLAKTFTLFESLIGTALFVMKKRAL